MISSEVQLAMIVAIPPTITSVGAIIIAILNDRRANAKLNHITVLTNSTLTAANQRIDKLEKQVISLKGDPTL